MSIWKQLFGKKEPKQQDGRMGGESLGMPVIDLRDDKERQIERDASAGKRLGTEVDRLIAELIEIGKTEAYLRSQSSAPKSKFNEDGLHIRARKIGEALNQLGGMELMQAAYYKVRATLGGDAASSLELTWGYIGNWRA